MQPGYMLGQFAGALIGSAILYLLTSTGGYGATTATGANAFGQGEMAQALVAEVVFTFIFVLVVLGSTDSEKGAGNLAGLAIGLTLVLVHIVCIPITGTSVNPARSFGPALFAGGTALCQLWLFIVAPFIGAASRPAYGRCWAANARTKNSPAANEVPAAPGGTLPGQPARSAGRMAASIASRQNKNRSLRKRLRFPIMNR